MKLPRPHLNFAVAARLIAAAAVWTLVGLVAGGLVLSGIFRASVEHNFDARLASDLDGMIAAAEPDPAGGVSLQGRFNDPRFERIYSGWYWQIMPARCAATRKAADLALAVGQDDCARTDTTQADGLHLGPRHRAGEPARALRRPPGRISHHRHRRSPTTPAGYTFLVAGDMSELEDEIADFNHMLFWSFALVGGRA